MPARIDTRDMERIFEAVETQRASDRDDVTAINEAPAETSLALLMLVEMNPSVVLVEPAGELMLGLLDGHAIEVINLFADLITPPSAWTSG